jgi:hypothetical protein
MDLIDPVVSAAGGSAAGRARGGAAANTLAGAAALRMCCALGVAGDQRKNTIPKLTKSAVRPRTPTIA